MEQMEYRTDLAVEYTEESTHRREEQGEYAITRLTHAGRRYVTVETPPFSDAADAEELAELLAGELRKLLPEEGPVLVAGLGNRFVTPDALGPRMADRVLATRHIGGELARLSGLDGLRPVAVLAPGVLGSTGVESGEAVAALTAALHPAAVIAVDALAARSLSRLGCTVQLTDAGISPGEGVGNRRPALSWESLGAPVIALGVPTVVDAAALAAGLMGGDPPSEAVAPRGAAMIVTPREIDLLVDRAARVLAMAVNRALNHDLSQEDFARLVS